MSGVLSTSVSAVDAAGVVFVYVPPNVIAIPRGFSVVNGTYNQIQAGDQVTLDSSGPVQFANGSGQLQAVGTVTYRVVTITAPPAPQQEAETA